MKKLLVLLTALALLIVCSSCSGKDDSDSGKKESRVYSVAAGDIVSFGTYEQDNNTSNGKENIEWLVLAKEGKRVLIISKYVLDCQQYNSTRTSVTWETCSLRKWLNETFLNAAFSSSSVQSGETKVKSIPIFFIVTANRL